MTNDYRPIACDQHSVLELLAMHRQRVTVLVEVPDGGRETLEARVIDVRTRNSAEYLVMETASGESRSVRLDRVVSITDGSRCVFRRQ